MKIAMLGHKRMPSREGGVEVVVEELATRMALLGHDVTVYSRKGHNVAGSEYDAVLSSNYKGVTVKEVPTIDVKGFAALTSSYFATKAAIADKPDIIHFHAEGPCAMIRMAKKQGIRTVATIHGLDWQRAKWGRVASRYIKYGEKTAACCADEIIVLSENIRNYFNNEYARDTHYIPNGVNVKTKRKPDIIAQSYGLNGNDYILYLGRIVPEKGLHYLLEAFANIDTEKKLVVAGGPSDSKYYFHDMQRAAEADERVIFTGFVEGEELEELFSNAALFVLPSDLEGMPMSLLEAMSYGLCCLTSDIPECADVLGSAGMTFARGNVAELARIMREALSNQDAAELFGRKAAARVKRDYCWDNVVRATLSIYER